MLFRYFVPGSSGLSRSLSSCRTKVSVSFLLTFVVLCCLSMPQSGGAVTCPSGWGVFQQNCYIVGTDVGGWDAAKTDCDGLGGHLASIHSDGENQFGYQLCLDHCPAWNSRNSGPWLGLRDRIGGKKFEWDDGTPVTYSSWFNGEPRTGYPLAPCGQFLAKQFHGIWGNVECNPATGQCGCYLCKARPPTTPTTRLLSSPRLLLWTPPSDAGSSPLTYYRVAITPNNDTAQSKAIILDSAVTQADANHTELLKLFPTIARTRITFFVMHVSARNGLDVWGPESNAVVVHLPSSVVPWGPVITLALILAAVAFAYAYAYKQSPRLRLLTSRYRRRLSAYWYGVAQRQEYMGVGSDAGSVRGGP